MFGEGMIRISFCLQNETWLLLGMLVIDKDILHNIFLMRNFAEVVIVTMHSSYGFYAVNVRKQVIKKKILA